MIMLGTLVNFVTVILGSLLGLTIKNGILKKYSDSVMKCIGLCTFFIGVTGMISKTVTNTNGESVTVEINTIIVILSLVIGLIIGEVLKLEDRLNLLGKKFEEKFKKNNADMPIATGFVSASLLFGVGSMSIIGPIQSGLLGDHSIQYSKALLDFISSTVFASSLGIGVIIASGTVLVYQGLITLLSSVIAPILNPQIIGHICCVGSITIVALSFNLLGITKLKIINFIPALFIPLILVPLFGA